LLSESPVDVVCNTNQRKNCSIRIGKLFCDGFNDDGFIGAFSHFHQDHIHAISECIGRYDTIITHPITFEAITAIDSGYRFREQWITQDYDTKFSSPIGDIRLLKANHIPGSAQIHIETENTTMLYSGDFNYPDIQIRPAEFLVLDSTHGDPFYDGKTDRKSVKNRMFEDIKEKMELDKPVIVYANSGTLQEIIKHFEINYDNSPLSYDIPFVTTKVQKEILLKIYKNEKNEFRDILEYDSHEFWKLVRGNKRCVIFLPNLFEPDSSLQNYYKILVDRYRFSNEEPAIKEITGGKRYNLAAHASIENIIAYVREVNPKIIVTDSSRSAYAPILAKIIHNSFPNITTYPRPK
jgi:Cft2 family RNA processing exonuclease